MLVNFGAVNPLGKVWNTRELDWNGTWTRSGPNTFNAKWVRDDGAVNPPSGMSRMDVSINASAVNIKRTNPDGSNCFYAGTINASGNVSGTFGCPPGVPGPFKWEGKISGVEETVTPTANTSPTATTAQEAPFPIIPVAIGGIAAVGMIAYLLLGKK